MQPAVRRLLEDSLKKIRKRRAQAFLGGDHRGKLFFLLVSALRSAARRENLGGGPRRGADLNMFADGPSPALTLHSSPLSSGRMTTAYDAGTRSRTVRPPDALYRHRRGHGGDDR